MTNEPGNVLLVDDDKLARLEIARCVEQLGHKVSQAEDGAQALSALRKQLFDLVLLDLLMPEVDGFEVLRQMSQDPELNKIPVIVVSAVGESDSTAKCLEMGAVDHLVKPLDYALFVERIGEVLTKSD